jgi:iron complex outermembrane receptor protein
MNWTQPTITQGIEPFSDGRLSHVPPFQGSAAATYTLGTQYGDAKLTVDYTWQGLTDFEPNNHASYAIAQYSQQPAYGLLDARLSFNMKSTNTVIAAYGSNLTDKYCRDGALDTTGAGIGMVLEHIAPPRTYGAEITQKFWSIGPDRPQLNDKCIAINLRQL